LLVEIKSGARVAPDTITAMLRIAAALRERALGKSVASIVVHGGDDQATVRDTLLMPWRAVADASWN
jgi:V8-like Glu-specific endopeptidase